MTTETGTAGTLLTYNQTATKLDRMHKQSYKNEIPRKVKQRYWFIAKVEICTRFSINLHYYEPEIVFSRTSRALYNVDTCLQCHLFIFLMSCPLAFKRESANALWFRTFDDSITRAVFSVWYYIRYVQHIWSLKCYSILCHNCNETTIIVLDVLQLSILYRFETTPT